MNWYVKHEGTGEIAGPMSESEALKIDGLVFNEGAFEQMQDQPSDLVIKITNDLQEIHDLVPSHDDSNLKTVCQRAIDAIYFLSRKKVVTGSIQDGVLDLDDVPEGVEVDIKDYDNVDAENMETDERGSHFQAG